MTLVRATSSSWAVKFGWLLQAISMITYKLISL